MKNSLLIIGLTVSIAACGVTADTESPRPRVVETITVVDAQSTVRRVFVGELRASDRTDLSFEVPGVIAALIVELGDEFQKGDLLGYLDARTFQLELETIQAQLRNAEAVLAEAELDYKRFSSLEGTGAVSKSAIDSASARLESAQAAVDALKAQVSRAREVLADTKLIAPYNGIVAERAGEPSQVVQPGQPVLRVTGEDAGFEAIIRVPESLLAKFELGLSTQLMLKPSNLEAQGNIIEVGRSANASGLYPVTIAIEEGPADRLKAGVRVEVAMASQSDEEMRVPVSAIGAGANGASFVMAYDADGTISQKPIEIGDITDAGAVVLSGLTPGDVIVSKGVGLLKDGEIVEQANAQIARFNQ